MRKYSFKMMLGLLLFVAWIAAIVFLGALASSCQKCEQCRQVTIKQIIVLKGGLPAPPSDTLFGPAYQLCGEELKTAATQATDVSQQYCGSIQIDTATGQTYIIDSAYMTIKTVRWQCNYVNH